MKADSSIKQRCKQRYRLRQFQGTPRSQHNNNNSNSSRNISRDLSTSTDVILSPIGSSVSQLTPLSQKENTTLLSLPAELITRISYNLTLPEYSRFSRTCKYLGNHFQKELILFLRYVYGLSVKSGSLVLYAYGAHLQYRAPKLLDRILDEFFVDANDAPNSGPNNNKVSPTSRQTNSRWPTYWSVLYSLDKAPNIDPPVINTNTSGIGSCCNECYFQPNQNMPCYKCASTQYQGSELMTNPNPKLQFLQKYAARMNAKFAGRSGRSVPGERSHNNSRRNEWLITDVRLKKTYNMLIMQNIRYGDVTLLRFYLDKYGAPINAQVTFSQEEQVYLGADSELMKLLDEYRIRVVLTP
ncbi:hypothetical protein RhiirA1_420943 [Rhizophagus irregularis]|uniref:F-box domain-containing protein n=3 Tax=Rhizophagus irregularis TaxID=588596 RepID=U9V0F4_RHIID|nr:hypothetical protein GLOIN_2v1510594 [Rhizophagus irregularis DAOM 181602=DAOM 197198]EXX75753.1 hypothetical protein RirG_039170 [Rhizophagus irregularis DAOM 197198w]PKC65047.1 hypothetical protein RhiirA1_420943 [Rhizophagus irregularis]PKK69660.1 hypothetical protein RhiirC2_780728 [Rhizophagus irregularis]POG81112.1 hypothetical protein GLOIN_2v1510594 [Rhizophagus irregularis DAOM 181602=DAOM 197198]UZO07937.1 hypothetical protein OCT59_028207 [Rhizophagus irregularis]|eukprot:XP_025187978.1 hypothetical protein GLOIN_2v1510594 [Rhizophagus irregularis DAOM 181602=DAOM 197198]